MPADGFYEWRAGAGPKAPKQPYTAALRDGTPMALAGLWEGWRGPGGGVVRTFTIITCEANDKLRALHDRMPVILPRAAWPAWLGEASAEAAALLALLRPYPSADLAAWPVPRRVGRVAEDGAPSARGPVGAAVDGDTLAGVDGARVVRRSTGSVARAGSHRLGSRSPPAVSAHVPLPAGPR